MSLRIRVADEGDIDAMHRIRLAVRENRLTDPSMIQADDYRRMLGEDGRGWVAESEGGIVGFAIGDLVRQNVWALFVHPDREGRGAGRMLHDAMMDWFAARGVERVWLSTDPGTRAEAFYRAAGWEEAGEQRGEARYEMPREKWLARPISAGMTRNRGEVLDPGNRESLSLVTDSSPADPDDQRT
ncbi:MAG TPA: GNAT family N-acetyltransferase [Longimicrobium sp.]